jgi:hypothetical protein
MRRMKTIGLVVAASLAISCLTAASALAVPEFLHEKKEVVKKMFKVKSKEGTTLIELSGTKYHITCKSSSSEGKIVGTTEVEDVVSKFKECKAKESEESVQCEVKSTSPAGGKEEIVTKELKGHLGVVAKAEATSEVGLLLEPQSGSVYVTITGSTQCLPAETSEVTGGLIGEVTPTGSEAKKGELLYKIKSEKTQAIRKFMGESGVHELVLFGVKTPLESKDTIEFEENVEVT